MTPVYTSGNWCYLDTLDGLPLQEGERLNVVWPDGSVETVEIDTEDSFSDDHERVLNRRAYFVREHRGMATKFYLRGSELKAERATSDVVPATDEQKAEAREFVARFKANGGAP